MSDQRVTVEEYTAWRRMIADAVYRIAADADRLSATLRAYDGLPGSVTEYAGKPVWVAGAENLQAIDSILALEAGFRRAREALERLDAVRREVIQL